MKKKLKLTNALTFQEGFDLYVRRCEARNYRPATIRHYNDSIKQIYKVIPPSTPIEEFNEDLWDYFRTAIRTPERNSTSVYTYSRDFKTLIKFFQEEGIIAAFPLELPKTDKSPIQIYTDQELHLLLKKPNLRRASFTEYKCWVIVNFLLSTGLRQNSLINLRINDIDFDNHLLRVAVTKNRKVLMVPLNRDIESILKEYLKFRGANNFNDYLFCNEYGDRLVKSTLYHSMYEYNKKRGVSTTGLHRFRHTFATKFIKAGGSVVALSRILGHSSLDITQNYINLLTNDLVNEVNEINLLASLRKETIKLTPRS